LEQLPKPKTANLITSSALRWECPVNGITSGKQLSPEEMFEKIRQLQKENEYLKRQREILKKAMSIVGEEPNPGMR
jgi:hypothetical protein